MISALRLFYILKIIEKNNIKNYAEPCKIKIESCWNKLLVCYEFVFALCRTN